jgi:hypothetical protein
MPGDKRECAFCPSTAKLTAEHITSEWLGEAFPGEKIFKLTDRFGLQQEWTDFGLDAKARVVCQPCNNGWMSRVEAKYGKPDLLPLMSGDIHAPFSTKEAHSLAIWAFLKCVVLDRSQRHREPFFSRRIRHAFAKDLFLPAIPFWPRLDPDYKWPGVLPIRGFDHFKMFHDRWDKVALV